MALQHLRSSTANKRPVPGNMSDGQLGINTNDGSPGLFFKDSNNALVKVGPVHVGTTAPNASPASGGTAGNSVGEQWLDTSGGTYVFKVWDGSAWRSSDVMTGALGIIAGSAGSPGLYFSGDTNTGIYSPGADQIAISTGGSGRLFVDANGNVGIADSSPQRDAGTTSLAIGDGSKSASVDLYGTVKNYAIYNGGSGQLGVFDLSASTERITLTSDGYVRLTSSSPGIQFNGDTAAANALNDYEEGTFTPTIVGTTGAGTGTYTNQIGRYTKIGDRVTFTIYLNWTAHTGTGNIRVSNLPFTSTSATGSFHAVSIYADGIPFTGPWLQAYVGVNSTNIGMGQMTAAGVVSGIPMDSAGDITITGHYEV